MVLFLIISTILSFETRFGIHNTMQYIDNWLGDSILVGSAYKIIWVEPLFRLSYFQLVSLIMIQIRSGSVSSYTSPYVCCTFCAVGGTVLPHLLMGNTVPERTCQRWI